MDMDLLQAVPKYWAALKSVRPRGIVGPLNPPPIQLVTHRDPDRYLGNGCSMQIFLSYGANVDAAARHQILLHELCHGAVCPYLNAVKPHGTEFRHTLRDAAEVLWDVRVDIPRHRYVLDELIIRELRIEWDLPPGPLSWIDARPERDPSYRR